LGVLGSAAEEAFVKWRAEAEDAVLPAKTNGDGKQVTQP
jgi:hypothetical protein